MQVVLKKKSACDDVNWPWGLSKKVDRSLDNMIWMSLFGL